MEKGKTARAEKHGQAGKARCAGIDDGRFGIKLVDEDFNETYIPSRLASGAQVISVGDEADDDNMYDTETGSYTVSEGLPPIDTRFGQYDISDINRVLVTHALIRAGYGGSNVRIVTGMPVSSYYLAGARNAGLIAKKVDNLTKGMVRNRNPNVAMPNIVNASVSSEAIAAFFDLLIRKDGTIDQRIQAMITEGPIGIIDIGGETTDSAVIVNGGKSIDASRSGTAKIGTLSLNASLESRLKVEFNLDALTPSKVEAAARTGKLNIFREDHDVSQIVHEEKRALASQIIAESKRKFGSAGDLECVFFVGGGPLLLEKELADLYPHSEIVPNPQFANARGMAKIAMFVDVEA